jgi:hypothetical protein
MNAVSDALYDALAAQASLAAAVGTRIYREIAPSGAAHPYVVYTKIPGSGDLTGNRGDNAELVYLVDVVSETSEAHASGLAAHVYTALHLVELSVAGWENIWTSVNAHVDTVEMDTASGRLYWHAGRQVRIRLSR